MPNKNYRRGYNYERKAIEELKKFHNCFYVMRSGGSKSEFDIIGFGGHICYAIQIKAPKKFRKPSKKEIESITKFIKPNYLWRGIWIWNSRDKKFEKFWY